MKSPFKRAYGVLQGHIVPQHGGVEQTHVERDMRLHRTEHVRREGLHGLRRVLLWSTGGGVGEWVLGENARDGPEVGSNTRSRCRFVPLNATAALGTLTTRILGSPLD